MKVDEQIDIDFAAIKKKIRESEEAMQRFIEQNRLSEKEFFSRPKTEIEKLHSVKERNR